MAMRHGGCHMGNHHTRSRHVGSIYMDERERDMEERCGGESAGIDDALPRAGLPPLPWPALTAIGRNMEEGQLLDKGERATGKKKDGEQIFLLLARILGSN
ncbi:hypothetical protein BRADI_5g16091v3 [Brachypodium distachyon]|uniref:Uncharacterized protein n=1 Tax=Brachypodium distachyon TaxID=15368 RepID=A0A2K2CHK8_BRADI|nr:hypothetical protein BRADI_5g16091v3 [Brachypodium distachyon]